MKTKNMAKPIVINLLGGPGCGKSTTAAGLFCMLKKKGYLCELVTEFAKDKVWEGSLNTLSDQIYVFGKQQHKMFRLKDKVDIIITDSPLLLSIVYDAQHSDALKAVVTEVFNDYDNYVFMLKRDIVYKADGRTQTRDEAEDIDAKCERLLEELGILHMEVNTSTAIEEIADFMCGVFDAKGINKN